MTQLMHAGKSWSGNERNCAFLNVGNGTFVDVSAVTGLDFKDDGRSVARVDWDQDGDQDLWLKNRTGPQLRFIRNDSESNHAFVSFKLTGKTCNRDAVGAKITIDSDRGRYTESLQAGAGYLSQSSKWVHFGLGESTSINRATITWPDGKVQKLDNLHLRKRYRITQGDSAIEVPTRTGLDISASPADSPIVVPSARIVLRQALQAPPSMRALCDPEHPGPTLLTLWAQWCAPCRKELATISAGSKRLSDCGLKVTALNVDRPADRNKATEFMKRAIGDIESSRLKSEFADAATIQSISTIAAHIRDIEAEALPLPMSFLISARGDIQLLYLGPPGMDTLCRDARQYGTDSIKAFRRGTFPGRWFFRTPRNLGRLSDDLTESGSPKDAAAYPRR